MAPVTINGQPIANASEIERGQFRITKAERTADGTMVMDLIAIKHRLDLRWNRIAEASYKEILNLLAGDVFYQVAYPDPQAPDGQRTITAYVGDITDGVWQRVGGVRYFRDVRIGLIER
ncbi:MAG: hypothetical protein RDU89_07045 [bacterium]|nr:hypothetical protein [bacterium]